MRILGVTCGIGSMMVHARGQHEIIGNIEWRKYYHTGTFEHNFRGSWMTLGWDKLTKVQQDQSMNPDLLIGHTNCGNYSRLNTTGFKKDDLMDIPYFMDVIENTQPKFFVMDNLPASLLSLGLESWINRFPNYKIELAWVSNYNYGNTQKNRNRLFYIGSKKELEFTFQPNEFLHDWKMNDVIDDLPNFDIPEINHILLKDDDIMLNLSGHYFELPTPKVTLKQFRETVPGRFQDGNTICYFNKAGGFNKKPGYNFIKTDHYSPTLDGYENKYKIGTCQPLTTRERARIQGIPDDFIFFPLISKSQADRVSLIKQTGKCMPTQFCDYITRLIADHLGEGPEVKPTGISYLKPNLIIQEQLQLCADLL